MERLCSREPYLSKPKIFDESRGFNPLFITRLNINYRSHPSIMHISAINFYDNDLICIKKPDFSQQKDGKNFRIKFHGVKGCESRDSNSPSWYNSAEIAACVKYLLEFYDMNINPLDVGIITPYRKQVEMIQQTLRDQHIRLPKVATIEEFQGGERNVIILSLVRTSARNLELDKKYNLGFVFNKKRFNVAVSRAMSLLIVVGDPLLFMKDHLWRQFLLYAIENKSYSGSPPLDILMREIIEEDQRLKIINAFMKKDREISNISFS